ncbi:MAG: hypothetical protein D6790_15075 [Caldilineae bacterium]|nr:MAG: hypothetical protein D6790_15075 [Caldilineae bacterium]
MLDDFAPYLEKLGERSFEDLLTAVMYYADPHTGLFTYSDEERVRAAKKVFSDFSPRTHARLIKAYRQHCMSPLANMVSDTITMARNLMSQLSKMDLKKAGVGDIRIATDILAKLPGIIEQLDYRYRRLIAEEQDDGTIKRMESGLERLK